MLHRGARYLTPILCVYMICLNFYIYNVASEMKGDARVVNYAGLVRGATQQLVKLELGGISSDDLMETLDLYIDGLSGTSNYLNIPHMEDPQFQSHLSSLKELWQDLKSVIYQYRDKKAVNKDVMVLSERHFNLANEAVFYAEMHSDKKMARLDQTKQMFWLATVLFILSICYEIGQRIRLQRSNERLGYLAFTDKKTGLPNRTRCEQVLDYYRSSDLPKEFVCMMFDLNNLKQVNDKYGHGCGDRLLRSFSLLLGQTSAKYGFVGRNGGDEFLALFERCTQCGATQFLTELGKRVEIYNQQPDVQPISFACGMAESYVDDAITVEKLLYLADMRMYEQKRLMKKTHQ